MAKEPTAPPEGATKPPPPPRPDITIACDPLTPDGRDRLFATKPGGPVYRVRTTGGHAPPEGSAKPTPPAHTSDPEFSLPNRTAGPDDEVVFSEAVTCEEHSGCMKVTTEMPVGSDPSRTSDPGYEPPSRTVEEHPDIASDTPTYSPPDNPYHWIHGDGPAPGPFWDLPPADVLEGSERGTIHEPYAIIEDMGSLFRDLCDDAMKTTSKMRSAALRYLCRALALGCGTAILGLLLIGAAGVVWAVWLFRFLDWAELTYWRDRR